MVFWIEHGVTGQVTEINGADVGRKSTSCDFMMSSYENIFRVTGPLCGEFTGHRWIPHTKASDAELWCFLWSALWIKGWVNNCEAGDLGRHCAQYDVIVKLLSVWIYASSFTANSNLLKYHWTITRDQNSMHLQQFYLPSDHTCMLVWVYPNRYDIGFNHGLPRCVKYTARGPPVTTKPDGEAVTGGPRVMYFTHHGKSWLKPITAHPLRTIAVQNCSYFTQMRSTTTAIDDSNQRRNRIGLGCSREATAPLILIFKLRFRWLNIERYFKDLSIYLVVYSLHHNVLPTLQSIPLMTNGPLYPITQDSSCHGQHTMPRNPWSFPTTSSA